MTARREKEWEWKQVPPEGVSLFSKLFMEKIQPNLREIALFGERFGCLFRERISITDASNDQRKASRKGEMRARHA